MSLLTSVTLKEIHTKQKYNLLFTHKKFTLLNYLALSSVHFFSAGYVWVLI